MAILNLDWLGLSLVVDFQYAPTVEDFFYTKTLLKLILQEFCLQTPRHFFDVQRGILKLDRIRAHELCLYSWDEASHTWTSIKNQIRIYGEILDVQPGSDAENES